MAQCALQNYSAQHSARYGSGSWVCNPMHVLISRAKTPIFLKFQMLPAPHVTLSMSGKIANILGPHYGWSLWKNEDLLADLVEFFCSGSAVQRSLWARLEKRVPVSEAEKKRRRTEAANAVTPLSVVDLVLLLKIPRRRYSLCARYRVLPRDGSVRTTNL